MIEFNKDKYLVVRDFFSLKDTKRMANRMKLLRHYNLLEKDTQCPLSDSVYGDPIHSEIQELYREKIENIIGIKLLPTYTYARSYSPREVLEIHSDRPACEISLTSTLEYDTLDNEPWEIFVEVDKENPDAILSENGEYGIKYKLYPGDALLYQGCKIKHWREMFKGFYQAQVFIHYVNKYGPYSACKYDFRPSLGSTRFTKNNEAESEFHAIRNL